MGAAGGGAEKKGYQFVERIKVFSRKDAKAQRKAIRPPGLFLCAFAPWREKLYSLRARLETSVENKHENLDHFHNRASYLCL